jgi:plasmid stabilization system protein ParE
MDVLFSQAAERLAKFPMMGRGGKIAGTRELFPHPNYRLVYETTGREVRILAIVHVARQWPPNEE